MSFVPPDFTGFTWHDDEAGGTPLDATDLMLAQSELVEGFQAGDEAVASYAEVLVAPTATALAAEITRAEAAEALAAPKASASTIVNHGSTASTARPASWGFVIWVGSVQPTNIQTQDLWIDTSS
jgi:hypothetical protein